MLAFLSLLTALLPTALTAGTLLHRQNFCASVTGTCPTRDNAYKFCSYYLDVKPQKSTTRITISTYVGERGQPDVLAWDVCYC